MAEWGIEDSKKLYNVDQWSDGYFDIDDDGEVIVLPKGKENQSIKLNELVKKLLAKGLTLPILIRFVDILVERMHLIQQAFTNAIAEVNYKGKYTFVYPIKTNQQFSVIETILEHGQNKVGIEVGSKPELIAVLGLDQSANSLIICNGYKDRQFIHLALMGKKLNKRIFIILEKLSELPIVIEEAKKLNVKPNIGVRVRLSSMAKGKWKNTTGEKAKFGFTAAQVLYVFDRLREENMLDCLQILHYHLGSQVANIQDIQQALHECSRFYCELKSMGANITTIDVGGGLGVDYEGTHTRSECSTNYSIQEYANNIVYTIFNQCDKNNLPHPDIITESGRALVAHHGMLVTNVIGVESFRAIEDFNFPAENRSVIIDDLLAYDEELNKRNAIETFHHCKHIMSESLNMFNYGMLSLTCRAQVEQLYLSICYRIQEYLNPRIRSHREVWDELVEKLADKYFCNFSIFQSIPDVWAIDQILPIMPLTHLQTEPDCHVRIQDITCDSDGCIDYYTAGEGVVSTILLPNYQEKSYYLGVFLVGAYQEILGDMHNLFGDTDSVSIKLTGDSYEILDETEGDCVEDVLKYVNIKTELLLKQFTQQLNNLSLPAEERKQFLDAYQEGLKGYTYLLNDQEEA